ncbi:MAG: 8-oxoguanine DNA glycosylase [Firmicutes bacterium]|nr:8-oxoguanine DNA glycosylase [Bacillota bacterium]
MNIEVQNNNIILSDVRDFDLRHIFDCGQCFRFNAIGDGAYTGVAFDRPLTISQTGDTVTLYETSERDFYDVWYDYFDFGNDYSLIKKRLSHGNAGNADNVMRQAVSYGGGIRILNQNLWEMIISFIISASNNIPRIKGIIERLCAAFGEKREYMGSIYYTFPDAERMSSLTEDDLSVIRAGFRDKYILDAVNKFTSGELSVQYLNGLDTSEAKKALMSVKGIGNKVSDCILLFGMKRTDSFPIDVWIKRIMEYCYFDGEPQTIDTVSKTASKKFGELGGYAQQYLFFYAREQRIGLD